MRLLQASFDSLYKLCSSGESYCLTKDRTSGLSLGTWMAPVASFFGTLPQAGG
jgi:hypothetical protein